MIKLNRQQLAQFLPNPQSIKVFESLLEAVATDLPSSIASVRSALNELEISEGIAEAKGNEALASLESIARSLDLLANAPIAEQIRAQEQIEVMHLREEVGVISQQISELQALPLPVSSLISILAGTGLSGGLITTSGTIAIANQLVAGGPTGDGATVPVITWNAQGQLTTVGTASITPASIGALPSTYLDIDGTLAANSDVKIASQKATKTYVDNAVTGLLDFKGATNCAGNPNYPAALKGDAYVVSAAGKIGGASGVAVDIGDVFVASADNAGGTQAGVGASWFILEHNLNGALLAANNLSDVADNQTARNTLLGAVNLGYFPRGNGTNVVMTTIQAADVPTLNQNTTGSAGTLNPGRTIDGQTFDGSTNITVIAPGTHAATSKATPVDADELPLVDSAASNVLKKLTWANLKATVKAYFDTLYFALGSYSTGTFTVTSAVNLVVVGGTGVTYTTNYVKIGKVVTFRFEIEPNGGTIAATVNSTYFTTDLAGAGNYGPVGCVNVNNVGAYGPAMTSGGYIFTPTIAATPYVVAIGGSYVASS